MFPAIWIDFFLLALFYASFRIQTFSIFFMVILWSIIYWYITFDNPGREVLALGTVWYMLSSFRFDTDIARLISACAGSCIYVIMKFCVFSAGCTWDIPVTLILAIYFVIIHTLICFIMIIIRHNLFREKLSAI